MIVKIIFDDLTTYFDIESWKTAVSSELKTCLSFKIKAYIPAFNFQDLESNSSFKKSRYNLTVGRIFQIFFWGQKALISLRKRYFIKAKKSISARRSEMDVNTKRSRLCSSTTKKWLGSCRPPIISYPHHFDRFAGKWKFHYQTSSSPSG